MVRRALTHVTGNQNLRTEMWARMKARLISVYGHSKCRTRFCRISSDNRKQFFTKPTHGVLIRELLEHIIQSFLTNIEPGVRQLRAKLIFLNEYALMAT
jgi:hypothetical protein